jgi:hypothetical protein
MVVLLLQEDNQNPKSLANTDQNVPISLRNTSKSIFMSVLMHNLTDLTDMADMAVMADMVDLTDMSVMADKGIVTMAFSQFSDKSVKISHIAPDS